MVDTLITAEHRVMKLWYCGLNFQLTLNLDLSSP